MSSVFKDTLILLRFPFSLFLLPVYLFALSQATQTQTAKTVAVFFILHVLVYPSSNGYNSYIDRDTEAIGGIEHPPEPPRLLFYVTAIMDLFALLCAGYISPVFSLCILLCILASRAYSGPWPRFKQYPILGFLVVFLLQGGFTFYMTLLGVGEVTLSWAFLWREMPGAFAASCFIGASYPLTQIYQHQSDAERGDLTLSRLLGLKGTMVFSAILFVLAQICFYGLYSPFKFMILQLFLFPVLLYFLIWAYHIWKDPKHADFKSTMKMNLISALCLGSGFLSMNLI